MKKKIEQYKWIIGLLLIPVFILALCKLPAIMGFCIWILWWILRGILYIFFWAQMSSFLIGKKSRFTGKRNKKIITTMLVSINSIAIERELQHRFSQYFNLND